MNKIGIIGNGFVGNAIHQGLKNHFDVLVYDLNPEKKINTFVELQEASLIFVCVPTPMTQDGNFDLSMVKDVAGRFIQSKLLVIKSTITPSAAEDLVNKYPMHTFVFNPEFLTERTAVEDFQNPSRIVLGSDNEQALDVVEEMYRAVFPDPLIQIIKTDTKTACFIKYFSNCFFAAKVALMNEFRQASDAAGIDWNTALTGLITSGWVNPMHTLVPGPDGDYGFGGKCFPKDINAFMSYCRELGVDPKMLKAAWNKNLEVRKNSDWLHIDGAVSKKGEKNEL